MHANCSFPLQWDPIQFFRSGYSHQLVRIQFLGRKMDASPPIIVEEVEEYSIHTQYKISWTLNDYKLARTGKTLNLFN